MKIELSEYKAFIFDLNGTMIDDMDYHVKAWHRIVNYFGANLSMDEVREQCYGKNNELMERVFPGRFSEEEKNKMGFEKEEQYQREYKPDLKLINGLDSFLQKACNKKIKMAIGSAAIPYNIDFVLDGLQIRKYFEVVVSADDVTKSKPDAETYLKCVTELNLDATNCLVFEDVPKGVESAQNAGMNCVVITTMHDQEEFNDYSNVIGFIADYEGLVL
ncbi:MAG: HAD family phosphatase [Ginsengibacter sp.]